MKLLILAAAIVVSAPALAEEKNCTVKGMHCEACVEMVKDRVCEGKDYAECDVKIKEGSKPKVGLLHIKTKEADAKIDVKAINTAMADTRYSVTCK